MRILYKTTTHFQFDHKLTGCDDKIRNIYLVEVEYTWIPSTFTRCTNLGHKEKICRLPPNLSTSGRVKSWELMKKV